LTVDDSGGKQYTTIQGAINAAQNGDTIKVWPGTYVPFVVNDPYTVPSSQPVKNLKIVSTYDPLNPPSMAEMDTAAGDENGLGTIGAFVSPICNTIIDGGGTSGSGYIITYCGHEDTTSELSGFLIKHIGPETGDMSGTGAILCNNGWAFAKVRISHNIFRNICGNGNTIQCPAGTIEYNVMCFNRSVQIGGASCDDGGLKIRGNIFRNNRFLAIYPDGVAGTVLNFGPLGASNASIQDNIIQVPRKNLCNE